VTFAADGIDVVAGDLKPAAGGSVVIVLAADGTDGAAGGLRLAAGGRAERVLVERNRAHPLVSFDRRMKRSFANMLEMDRIGKTIERGGLVLLDEVEVQKVLGNVQKVLQKGTKMHRR